MKYLILSLLIGFPSLLFSQKIIYDTTKEIHIKSHRGITPSDSTIDLQIKVRKAHDDTYTIQLKANNKEEDYIIKPLQFDSFSHGFKRAFNKLTRQTIDDDKTNLQLLFMDLVISRTSEEKAPLAGTLLLEDKVYIGWYAAYKVREKNETITKRKLFREENFNDILLPLDKRTLKRLIQEKDYSATGDFDTLIKLQFIPQQSQIEFSEGYIRNISIEGQLINADKPNDTIYNHFVFMNDIPIGFSSLKDYSKLYRANLKSFHKYQTIDIQAPLPNFLCYHPNLRINTRDYCPKDEVRTIQNHNKEIKLYKEESAKILNAKIFTDVLGLQDDNPNGIIQTEVEKRFSVRTRRFNFWSSTNIGFLQYIKPYIILRKIEKQNKYLELNDTQNKDSVKVNTLNLLRHETFRSGTDINLITIDERSTKSSIYLDIGGAFSKVIVSDTITSETAESNKTHINNFDAYAKAKISLFPDERYGINFSYQLNYYIPLNHKIDLLPIKDGSTNKNWLQNMEMIAFLKTNNSGKVFFRYRLNSSLTNWSFNFAQIQLGYSFDISKQIK